MRMTKYIYLVYQLSTDGTWNDVIATADTEKLATMLIEEFTKRDTEGLFEYKYTAITLCEAEVYAESEL